MKSEECENWLMIIALDPTKKLRRCSSGLIVECREGSAALWEKKYILKC